MFFVGGRAAFGFAFAPVHFRYFAAEREAEDDAQEHDDGEDDYALQVRVAYRPDYVGGHEELETEHERFFEREAQVQPFVFCGAAAREREAQAARDSRLVSSRQGVDATEEVLARIPADITRYKEYVFCGFGEPTLRLDALLSIGKELKRRGATVRLNTNGQADLIHKRDVSSELASAVDKINVSLNEATADAYAALCKPAFGEAAFSALQTFAANCAKRGIDTWLSVVDILGQEKLEACRKIAAACGVPLKVRPYIA